jgi:DNA/RNA-binding domain of Phe-tRNA-synthetase-like protein
MAHTIVVEPHPLLELGVFVTRLARPLGETLTPPLVASYTDPDTTAPVAPSDQVRAAIRDMLRHGGFKPAGRSKPASEYLLSTLADGKFPSINAVVDTCNVVSMHSGIPISVVDVAKLDGPLAIRVAPQGTSYVFNPSGQLIDASGLVCLYDDRGPAGTPVKDAQRTKTDDSTRTALSILWGTNATVGLTARTTQWYRTLMLRIDGAQLEEVTLVRTPTP